MAQAQAQEPRAFSPGSLVGAEHYALPPPTNAGYLVGPTGLTPRQQLGIDPPPAGFSPSVQPEQLGVPPKHILDSHQMLEVMRTLLQGQPRR